MARHTPRLNAHLDNCHVYFSKVTEQLFSENKIVQLPHPPYGPDLAPSDFCLFGSIKTEIVGRSFGEPGKLLEGIQQFLQTISAEERKTVFHSWAEHVRWVIAYEVLYSEE
jgi:histone-lysine N-methyltransferase SETMAR